MDLEVLQARHAGGLSVQGDYLSLAVAVRIADIHLEEEAVELGFGQRVGAFLLRSGSGSRSRGSVRRDRGPRRRWSRSAPASPRATRPGSLGGVRLISSASSTCVNSGPFFSTKRSRWKSKRFVPITSPGMRSGVNWMRRELELERRRERARQQGSWPVPGTPWSNTCPRLSSAINIKSIERCWPRDDASNLSVQSRTKVQRCLPGPSRIFPSPAVDLHRSLE